MKPELDFDHLNVSTRNKMSQNNKSLEGSNTSQYRSFNRSPMHSEFTLKVRKEQPPMCGGRALKINSEIPVVQSKQTTAKSVYSKEIYKPGQSANEETLTAPNSKFDYSTLHREIKGK